MIVKPVPVTQPALFQGNFPKPSLRAIDTDKAGLGDVLRQAHGFAGASLTEIFQNCIVYNDKVFADFSDRQTAADNQLRLVHGEPMLFGANNEKGIRFNSEELALEVIDAEASPGQVLRHDEGNYILAQLLVDLVSPVALGVIYRNPGQSFEASWHSSPQDGLRRSRSVNDVIRGTRT